MSDLKIKEMDEENRPREKALRFGLETLSDEELVALILQSGSKNNLVMDMARNILKLSENLSRLYDLNVSDLMQIPGIKEVKALNIMASVELCKRVMRKQVYQTQIRNPKDILSWFQTEIGFNKQEHFIVLYLDSHSRIISHKTIFIGTLTESCVHPRDIFKEAFLKNADSILCLHNHPSGDPSPSDADFECTAQLELVGETMGIALVDHVIITRNACYSFKEHGYLD